MRYLLLLIILFLNLISNAQIKFQINEAYTERYSSQYLTDTISCDMTIVDDSSERKITIKVNGKEKPKDIFQYEYAYTLFTLGNHEEAPEGLLGFSAFYNNVFSLRNNKEASVFVYRFSKDIAEKNKIYYIKIQKNLNDTTIYKANLIEGEYPEY